MPPRPVKDPYEIVDMYEQRQVYYGKDIARMREMQRLMNNEMDPPLPEIAAEERPLIANLALRGMEQLSQRIASVDPILHFPSTNSGSQRANNRARDRKRIMQGWHEDNDMYSVRSLRARHFLAWATSPVIVKPDPFRGIPKWEVKRPLETFPPPGTFTKMQPEDMITCDIYAYKDLVRMFGHDTLGQVQKPPQWNWDDDSRNANIEFELLEYIDRNEISLIIVGHASDPSFYHRHQHNLRSAVRVSYAPNLTDMPLGIQPGRIVLDEQLGHFDGIVGMYQAQSAFMALLVIGQRRAVWPREWITPMGPNDPEDPDIDQNPDPYRGIPGVIHHGQIVQQNLDPSFRALEIMDRQDDALRREAGVPSEMLGSQRTHISAMRGRQVMGATIDFTIAEAQNIFARSLKLENELAMEIDKAFFPSSKSYAISTRSYVGKVNYTPSETWETSAHLVEYPLAGVDLQNLPIEGGQRVQMGALSLEGFMEVDPMIKDVKAELQRLDREAIKRAFLTVIQNLAGTPDPTGVIKLEPSHLIKLDQKLLEGIELYEAWEEIQEEIKQQQAEMAMAQQAGMGPEAMAGGMQGLMPGMDTTSVAQGAAQGAGTIPQPPDSLARFTQLLGSLGTAQQAGKYRG